MRVRAYFSVDRPRFANVINKRDYNFNESINLLLCWVGHYITPSATAIIIVLLGTIFTVRPYFS